MGSDGQMEGTSGFLTGKVEHVGNDGILCVTISMTEEEGEEMGGLGEYLYGE